MGKPYFEEAVQVLQALGHNSSLPMEYGAGKMILKFWVRKFCLKQL